MRYVLFLLGCLLATSPAYAQFVVDDARPTHGSEGVALSSEVAFAFSEEISVSTDWSTAFLFEPRDALSYSQVSLCLNFEGACGGGDDVPRFVRFQAEHAPATDYTWMVYAVKTAGGDAMDAPFVLRYTTAPTIGQQEVAGAVQPPVAKSTWAPPVRAALRTLARGLKRSGLGRPVFDREPEPIGPDATPPAQTATGIRSHFGALGAKSHSGGHTQILLLSAFSDTEAQWSVRAADVIAGASGAYTVEYVRAGTYWPVAVRYTDGTNTEIEAFGFHDANGDGAPDPVSTEAGSLSGIDIQLYEFPLTTARAQANLEVASDSAAQYASDQSLRLVEAGDGMRPAGTAYRWTYRFYSASEALQTRVTVDPLEVSVDTSAAPGFLAEMSPIPDGFIDSDEALQTALDDGGQAFIDPYRPRNITTILQGGNLYWTDSPVPSAEFWRVRLVTVTSSRVETFDRFIDMASGAVLDAPDATFSYDITRSFGDPSQQSSYRLVALPGDGSTPVASTLDGAAEDDWTVYWDDGSTDDFLQQHDGSSTFDFRPGRGFWMLSRTAWAPSGTADAVALSADGTYAIDVHDGWNIIANPFDADLPWSAVQAANGVTQTLWRWTGSFNEATAFASAQGGEAFYFLNDQGLDQLVLPYPGAPDPLPTAAANGASRRTLTLTAFQGGARRSAVQVGTAPNAADGRDAFDQFAPPGHFERVALRLVNPRVDERYSKLAAEYRAAQPPGHTFTLSLRTTPGEPVTLRAGRLAAFEGQDVVLVDPSVSRSYDLQAARSVTLRPDAENVTLKLLIGSAAFVDAARSDIVPTTLQLLPNYPNPFQAHTTLAFTLPTRQDVRLVIYDVLGRRVRTLEDRSFEPGRHAVRWDGRNAAGHPVASGLYLGRLEVGAQRHTQRLVLIR